VFNHSVQLPYHSFAGSKGLLYVEKMLRTLVKKFLCTVNGGHRMQALSEKCSHRLAKHPQRSMHKVPGARPQGSSAVENLPATYAAGLTPQLPPVRLCSSVNRLKKNVDAGATAKAESSKSGILFAPDILKLKFPQSD
jgi:hypothetical protein